MLMVTEPAIRGRCSATAGRHSGTPSGGHGERVLAFPSTLPVASRRLGSVRHVSSLEERLRHGKWNILHDAVREAIDAGEVGESLLATVLLESSGTRQVTCAAALGDASGSAGPAALRTVLHRADAFRDLKCASLLALAKRCGSAASGDLAEALGSRDAAVKEYAVLGLAAVGDGRAWEEVLHRLRKILRNRERPDYGPPTPVQTAISYLARHAGADGERLKRIVVAVRRGWPGLLQIERGWLEARWPRVEPDIAPDDQVALPNLVALTACVEDDPLLGPAF